MSTASIAECQLSRFAASVRASGRFASGEPVWCGRAPGRLDVMGGVADYSGGVVLEGTLADATLVAVQSREDGVLRLASVQAGEAGMAAEVEIPLGALLQNGVAVPLEEAAKVLGRPPDRRWTAYAAGCLHILLARGRLDAARVRGLSLLADSSVPMGAGVSSSAALEVASMTALCGLHGITLGEMEAARLCQLVENQIAGAPCGIMDQVTCALGREDSLVMLKCQPHDLLGHAPIPPGWRVVALDSGVKHSVGGSHYARARVAAFMGLRIVQEAAGRSLGGYLANLSPSEWRAIRDRVPERLTGTDFLRQWGSLPDSATTVDPGETYRVRDCAEHPVLEDERVREFAALLQMGHDEADDQLLREAGALMLESHRSYSERLDLGSPETDLLLALAMEHGPESGIYGGRITGGGSGGSVALLCAGPLADAAIEEVRQTYRRRTGIDARRIEGSSPGALELGPRVLLI